MSTQNGHEYIAAYNRKLTRQAYNKYMNRTWHEQNKMPAKPTRKQRAKWHAAHLKYCNCRKPTLIIQKLMDEFKSQ